MSIREQRVHLLHRALVVVGALPNPAQPRPQRMHRRQLRVVVIAASRPPVGVQVRVERGLIAELRALDALTVDQRTGGTQCELGVMTGMEGC